MPKLTIEQRNRPIFDYALFQDVVTIGRGASNDLHFRDPWLSRDHARLTLREDRWIVEDVGSRNGTFLNGKVLEGIRFLGHGDVVTLGDVQLTFFDDDATGVVQVADSDGSLSKGTVMIPSDRLLPELGPRLKGQEHQEGADITDPEMVLAALKKTAAALISHFPVHELMARILELVFDAVPAQRGALLLRTREGRLDVVARQGFGADEDIRVSRTLIDTVVGEKKALLTMDAQSDSRFGRAESIMMEGIRSILCAPLVSNERGVLGLLYLDDPVSREKFNQDTLRLVGLIANLAAVKIENHYLLEEQIEKKRMEEQLAVGAQIQRRLLPDRDPEIEGYDICGVNRSCFEIGGDYYDFIRKSETVLAVVIADISGKGVGAALLMAVLQASIRALVPSIDEPADLVQRLNQVLVENSPDNKFATLFYAELDLVTHRLTYVSGGHNPSLLLVDGEIEELSSTGPIVGLVRDVPFHHRVVDMPPGATLLMFTDGVTELSSSNGDELGTDPLFAILKSGKWQDANELVDLVHDSMCAFAASDRFDDDSTLVVLRRLPADGSRPLR